MLLIIEMPTVQRSWKVGIEWYQQHGGQHGKASIGIAGNFARGLRLGLILWEMLFRAVPYGEFSIAQSLVRQTTCEVVKVSIWGNAVIIQPMSKGYSSAGSRSVSWFNPEDNCNRWIWSTPAPYCCCTQCVCGPCLSSRGSTMLPDVAKCHIGNIDDESKRAAIA